MFKKKQKAFKPVNSGLCHASGLPIPEGTFCKLHLTERGLEISGGGASFSIGIEKITDMAIKTDKDIHTQFVSSAGGAIGGAMLFGVPGALLGGRTKEKTKTTYAHFLTVTYKKDDTLTFIAFSLAGAPIGSMQFVKQFEILTQGREKEVIQL